MCWLFMHQIFRGAFRLRAESQMILVLDNYDSFTFNLVSYLAQLGQNVEVVRSDQISPAEALSSGAKGFLISPGPGTPSQAGHSKELVLACATAGRPLLGVCLGHQCIAEAFGATVERSPHVMHGKTSRVWHDGTGLFEGLPSPFMAARYHSLVVSQDTLPQNLSVNAFADDGTVQGIQHRVRPIYGVQFHPESIASEQGLALLRNFIALMTPSKVSSRAGLPEL